MWHILQRSVLPILLALAGSAAVIYGAKYHALPVAYSETEEQEREVEVPKTIRILVPSGMGGGAAPWGQPSPDGESPQGEGNDGAPPGMKFISQKVQVKETIKVPVEVAKVALELEPAIIREMTVGGVERFEGGLRRTYSGDEPPPSLCPT